MKNQTKTKQKPQKLKDTLQQNHQILEALASKDKKELRKCAYVAYDDVIEFPKPVAFTIKKLKSIIKDVEKAKLKSNNILAGIMIEIPIPLKEKIKFPKKITFRTKSVKTKFIK